MDPPRAGIQSLRRILRALGLSQSATTASALKCHQIPDSPNADLRSEQNPHRRCKASGHALSQGLPGEHRSQGSNASPQHLSTNALGPLDGVVWGAVPRHSAPITKIQPAPRLLQWKGDVQKSWDSKPGGQKQELTTRENLLEVYRSAAHRAKSEPSRGAACRRHVHRSRDWHPTRSLEVVSLSESQSLRDIHQVADATSS